MKNSQKIQKYQKILTEFHKNKNRKDGYQHICKDCKKIYIHENYLKNKKSYFDRNIKTRNKNKELVWNIKLKSKCIKCGENHPAVLDFHHKNKKKQII